MKDLLRELRYRLASAIAGRSFEVRPVSTMVQYANFKDAGASWVSIVGPYSIRAQSRNFRGIDVVEFDLKPVADAVHRFAVREVLRQRVGPIVPTRFLYPGSVAASRGEVTTEKWEDLVSRWLIAPYVPAQGSAK